MTRTRYTEEQVAERLRLNSLRDEQADRNSFTGGVYQALQRRAASPGEPPGRASLQENALTGGVYPVTKNSRAPESSKLCMVRPAGIEPATYGFEARRSIQLSYGRT